MQFETYSFAAGDISKEMSKSKLHQYQRNGHAWQKELPLLLSYACRVEAMVARREKSFQRLRLNVPRSCRH
jgi:hypothetical protein